MVRALLTILLCLVALATASAADTSQSILDGRVATLQVYREGDPLSLPVITAGSGERIVISFDMLEPDRRYLRYEVQHCNAMWQPSQLVESEYLDGFNVADIDDYSYSQATLMQYVHYRITLPNADMAPLLPGNYLLRVYDSDDPDSALLQARFYINEGSVEVAARATSRTDIDYNGRHQQVEVTVDRHDTPIYNMYDDLLLVVEQNGRQDNVAVVQHPLRVSGSVAVYEHLRPLIFAAGNEYRRMETVSTQYPGMGVERTVYVDPYWHFVLGTDTPRRDGSYLYDRTQQGRYVVREYTSVDSDTEADYAVVHFTLDTDGPVNGDIYLDGDLTLRRLDPTYRLSYDAEAGVYRLALLLKQGAYNYQYLLQRPDGILTTALEGDYFPTVNEYSVRVYHRPPGARYDRLVGVGVAYGGE